MEPVDHLLFQFSRRWRTTICNRSNNCQQGTQGRVFVCRDCNSRQWPLNHPISTELAYTKLCHESNALIFFVYKIEASHRLSCSYYMRSKISNSYTNSVNYCTEKYQSTSPTKTGYKNGEQKLCDKPSRMRIFSSIVVFSSFKIASSAMQQPWD